MSVGNPNWQDLRIFLEVVRAGTFGGAARRLKVDHSTISRHVARLEEAINVTVFERDNQGLKITPRGREIVEHVEAMEISATALAEVLGGSHGEPSGCVRLATMEGIASLYLAGELVKLRRQHRNISVELVTTTQQMHVNQREADIFLSFFRPDGKALDAAPVGEFVLHLYASPQYLSEHGAPVDIEALAGHRFASYIDDLIQLDTVRWLKEVMAQPRLEFQSSSMLAQLFAAVEGAGIVMLPSFARAHRFGLVRILANEVKVKRTVWMTVHRELQYLPRIKVVTRFLRDIMERDHPVLD
ncbi:LysR family transcriptional regulator [Burkholderia gladioli]|uniref:LysR family transcriptional regulator n=1 Tax=Burkholderia gladioli TaxID=28095 RepID=UPI0016422460|nr:LysR family transcriptional regulator [Burkholderia gladioli]